MDEAVDRLTHLGEADELADLLRGDRGRSRGDRAEIERRSAGGGGLASVWLCLRLQVVESLPREVLPLDLLDNVLRDALELSERRLAQPHPPVDHLAEAEHAVGERRPPALEHNLVEAAHQPRG